MSNNPNDEMEEILRDKTKKKHATRGVGGILASMWREILFDLEINGARFDFLCNQFIAKARKGMGDSRVSNYFNRGNLRRELAKPKMTFKALIKALKLLEVIELTISFDLKFRSGKVSYHKKTIDVASALDEYEGIEED
jgi:hypothetical protein